MKSYISKFLIAAFGITLATAPLTASAAEWSVGVNVGGPCYRCERPAPPPRYERHRYGYAPAQPVFYEGYYGRGPSGYNGYYSHGRWFGHRRRGNGFWIYF